MRHVAGAALAAACIACTTNLPLPEERVHVKVAGRSLCIPRHLVDERSSTKRETPDGALVGHNLGRVYLYITPEELRQGSGRSARVLNDANNSRSVQLMLQPTEGSTVHVPSTIASYYEPTWINDSGFRSHRRRRDCVTNFPPYNDTSCLTEELKYGHAAVPTVVFTCIRGTCWLYPRIKQNSLWWDYGLPQELLGDWASLHNEMGRRVHDWATNTSCIKGIAAH
jgi:hypothetical protein